jgi:Flp pilus assembly pilin Flp
MMWLRMLADYATFALLRFGIGGVRLPARSRGQSMVEYAIVAALIAVVAMATVQTLGTGIDQVFQNIVSKVQGIGTGGGTGTGPGTGR